MHFFKIYINIQNSDWASLRTRSPVQCANCLKFNIRRGFLTVPPVILIDLNLTIIFNLFLLWEPWIKLVFIAKKIINQLIKTISTRQKNFLNIMVIDKVFFSKTLYLNTNNLLSKAHIFSHITYSEQHQMIVDYVADNSYFRSSNDFNNISNFQLPNGPTPF